MRSRIGLRGRVAAWFAVIALGLSLSLGMATFFVVKAVLVGQFEESALDQTVADGRVVAAAVRESSESQLLASLRPPVRSRPFLFKDGEWFSASLQLHNDDLPLDLIETVTGGSPARQRFAGLGTTLLVVGLPIESGVSAYFEVFSLESMNRTLATLRATLLLAGLGATIAAGGLGAWAARLALRPLRQVETVAEEIAAGALNSRLDESLDPDLAKLSAAFNRMADSVAARITRETRFAADVSHELRSPLTTVMASVAILDRRRAELSDEGQEALDLLEADVLRLHRMILDLLELARLDAGQEAQDLEEAPVGEAVSRVVGRLRPELEVSVSPSALGVTVAVDLRRLERVLANYIDNADMHGGGAVRVRVTSEGEKAIVAVEDVGIGMDSEDLDRVFGRFARGSRASNQRASGGGSGLGLALAAENARMMGGVTRLEQNEPTGTRAVIELPVVVG